MTYLYGRCRPSVFGQLKNIQSGAEANVKTNNGYMFSYKLREKHDVKPEDTKLFSYGGNPILVLQTCSGIWSQNRQQFTFDFVKYEKQ
jgi:sortase (surface protein transpeptidase)